MRRSSRLGRALSIAALSFILEACTTDDVGGIAPDVAQPPDGSADGPARQGGSGGRGGSAGAGAGGMQSNGGATGAAGAAGGTGGAAGAPANCAVAPATKKAGGAACACDNECSGGVCIQGACCTGAACNQRPEGATCETGAQCRSGFCVDKVCCNLACTGACVSCNQPGKMGECRPVPAGEPDPHDICRKDAPDTCGQNGLCNGQGGCAKHAAGTICKAATCSSTRNAVAASVCDGMGTCLRGITLDCAPFTCDAGACRSSCTSSSQCTGAACTGGRCGKFPLGSKCARNDECSSNFCVDGVCCNEACGSRCAYCAFANSPGRCVAVPAGVRDPRAAAGVRDPARVCLDQGAGSCGTNGRCNGSRGCETYPADTVCRTASCDPASNTETAAGVCRDGRCQVPAPRTCAPFMGCNGARCSSFCDANDDCVGGAVCQNGSCGKLPIGAPCSRGDQCASPGFCAQGRCCATACSGSCQSCALEGTLGQCKPVPSGGTDPTGTCGKDACTDGCNGAGGCKREAAGTPCKDASCGAANTLITWKCSAAGACEMSSQTCSAGEACTSNRCARVPQDPGGTCVANSDCKSNACVNGRCCETACTAGCKTCSEATGWKCSDVTCPAGQVCNAADGNKCEPIARNQGEPCGGDNGACKTGLHCVMNVCCNMQCSGPCLTGKCGAGGAGCEPKPSGTDCGTACSNTSTLVTKKCDSGGTCASTTTMCGAGEACSGGKCEAVMTGKGPGEACSGNTPCASGLTCVEGICCMQSCGGACHDGCKSDGSGCKLRDAGYQCGSTTCSGTTLTKQQCNDSGECKPVTSSCPSGQACSGTSCVIVKKDAGAECGSTTECKDGLTCISGVCCMASTCAGSCLTGACKADGSGCVQRAEGYACGATTCSGTTLTKQLCNAAGECKPAASTCPSGQTCVNDACGTVMQPPPAARKAGESCGGSNGECETGLACVAGRCCKSSCEGECLKGTCDSGGNCEVEPEGTMCAGNSGKTCQNGICKK